MINVKTIEEARALPEFPEAQYAKQLESGIPMDVGPGISVGSICQFIDEDGEVKRPRFYEGKLYKAPISIM